MRYDKEKKFLEASGNIVVSNNAENIQINSENITYDKNIEKITSSGNVEISLKININLIQKR